MLGQVFCPHFRAIEGFVLADAVHDPRQASGVVHFRVVADDEVNFSRINNLGDVHEKLVGKLALNGVDQGDFFLVVELQKEFKRGSVKDRKKNDKFSEADEAVLLHQWMSDQIALYRKVGQFHTDGHLGNILVDNDATAGYTTFVWNDFGRTTSYMGHPEQQFCHTLEGVSKFSFQSPEVAEIARRLPEKHCGGENCCVVLNKPENDVLVSHFDQLLGKLEKSNALKGNWHRLSGLRMGERVSMFEQRMTSMEEELKKDQARIAWLEKEREKDRTRFAALEKQIQSSYTQTYVVCC